MICKTKMHSSLDFVEISLELIDCNHLCGGPGYLLVSYSQACRRYLYQMCQSPRNIHSVAICAAISPERVPHKSFEESSIAWPSVKAESNKGPAIPDSVHFADHLGSDVKQVASEDGDPAIRGTVPPPLKKKTQKKTRTSMDVGKASLCENIEIGWSIGYHWRIAIYIFIRDCCNHTF